MKQEKEQPLVISFKFSIFDLQISHPKIKELGEFTLFCMKAIAKDVKIKNISNIIQIKDEIIKKQLTFAISRKYLTDDFILTEKGSETVQLFEFINNFNEKKVKIALEHYIEDKRKQIHPANNKKFHNESKGYLLNENLYHYKLSNIFDEIIENDRNNIKKLIINDFKDYETVIEKHLNDFIFKINKKDEQKFYNYEIDDNKFINELKNRGDKINTFIPLDIPMLEINKDITSDFLNEAFINSLKAKFENFRYFNLINGQVVPSSFSNTENKSSNKNLQLEAKFTELDIVKKFYNSEKFIIEELLLIDMKTEVKKFYETKFFDITKIMDEI